MIIKAGLTEASKGKMDLFSTLTFFPLVLQIGLSGKAPEAGFVKITYGATAPY
jgi:hypothetical protein